MRPVFVTSTLRQCIEEYPLGCTSSTCDPSIGEPGQFFSLSLVGRGSVRSEGRKGKKEARREARRKTCSESATRRFAGCVYMRDSSTATAAAATAAAATADVVFRGGRGKRGAD